jgi:nitrogen regulatory protein PII
LRSAKCQPENQQRRRKMYLLVNVLEQTARLPGILEGLAKIGVRGTTILNSSGMGRVLMTCGADLPATDEAKKVLIEGQSSNKTLFTVIKDEETLQEAINVIRSFCGNLSEPGKGILFAFPLEYVEGLT